MKPDEFEELTEAARQLESSSLTTRISQVIGMPIDKALSALPGHWSTVVTRVTKTALEKAMDGALLTLSENKKKPFNKTHKFLAGLSGAAGGAFGIAALAVELPVSATIMLRTIADIARSKGERLDDLDTKMACLTVFALSGGKAGMEASDTSYYAVRSFLTKSLGDTSKHLAVKGLSKEGAPALVKLVNSVAQRFSIPVSKKLVAQSIPAIGAIGGAAINLIFIDHFQQMANAHFTVRKLERKYGEELVKLAYTDIILHSRKEVVPMS